MAFYTFPTTLDVKAQINTLRIKKRLPRSFTKTRYQINISEIELLSRAGSPRNRLYPINFGNLQLPLPNDSVNTAHNIERKPDKSNEETITESQKLDRNNNKQIRTNNNNERHRESNQSKQEKKRKTYLSQLISV